MPTKAWIYQSSFADYIDYSQSGDLESFLSMTKTKPDNPTELPNTNPYWNESFRRSEFIPLLDDFDQNLYFIDDLQNRLPGEWSKLTFFFKFANIFLGPPGTNVYMHADYWSSHTFIGALEGRKHAILFGPKDDNYIFNKQKVPLDPRHINPKAYPDFNKATMYEGILEPGELIYLPANWSHDIIALTPAISLSWNGYTTHNYGAYMSGLLNNLDVVIDAIKANPTLSKREK